MISADQRRLVVFRHYDISHSWLTCELKRELQIIEYRLMLLMNFTDNIRATLLYFDIFDYPLSREELYTFFPEKFDVNEFNKKLLQLDIQPTDGLYHLRNNDEVVAIRKGREQKAKLMLLATKIVAKLLRYFPFVRGAFLSGSLSKGVNDGDADIDLFIITAEQRLWICRSFLIAFKKLFLLNNKKFLCPNYFVTEHHLEIPEKNIFTATELITLRPLFNERKLHELLDANRWLQNFFPNFRIDQFGERPKNSSLQKLLELPMRDGYTSNWDARLMYYFKGVWKKKYPEYNPEEREFQFRSNPFASKMHPNDFQTKVIYEYEKRLRGENLKRLIEIDD